MRGMNFMFGEIDRENIQLAWNDFINQKRSSRKIRPEIFDSWQRSVMYGVDTQAPKKTILDQDSLNKQLEIYKDMINIATPIMHSLNNLVGGSGFLVVLADAQGYILSMVGDDDIYKMAQNNMLIVGANRSEVSVGTNAIGTCLFLNKPIQVWADEHFVTSHKLWACSAAPIHDPRKILLGCISITGPWQKVHLHTLGMVVSTAEAIQKQMEMQKALDDYTAANYQMDAILESISFGIILINTQGNITQFNKNAIHLLNLEGKKLIGESFDKLFRYDKQLLDLTSLKRNVYDHELKIETDSGDLHCTVTATIVSDDNGDQNGIVVTFKEIKHVRKLINTMTGSHARFDFENIIGNSLAIKETISQAKIATKSPSNVLLIGESGTGKELFAQSIHNGSARSRSPFIAINCGALPRGLIESELFGYAGGAFTGANKNGNPGKLELADGGTLFLDEIGDMPLDVQVSLLRFLQNREIERIGGKKSIPVDVRVIAATHKDLEECVENNTFRYDLFYRLNVLAITIPPLKERKSDIPLLADYFFSKYRNSFDKPLQGIDPSVYDFLYRFNWPGNIRQLENIMERAVNVAQGDYITINDLPEVIRVHQDQEPSYGFNIDIPHFVENDCAQPKKIKEFEEEAIINALQSTNGNVKKTAEILGFSRRTIYRKFIEYDIDHSQYRAVTSR